MFSLLQLLSIEKLILSLHILHDTYYLIQKEFFVLHLFSLEFYNNPDLRDTITIWDSQLVSYGKQIIERRKGFVDQLNEIIYDIHKNLSGGKEELFLKRRKKF